MIKTKASLLKEKCAKDGEQDFKVVKFTGLKRLPKTKPPQYNNKNDESKNSEDEAFDEIFGDGPARRKKPKKDEVTFDKARKEVMNLGISGAADKSDQITNLLIKLGAKPPKNQARNYKEILNEKKKQKEDDEKINKRAIFGTSASLQYRSQKKKSRKNDGLLRSYGRVDKESIRKIQQKGSSKRIRK